MADIDIQCQKCGNIVTVSEFADHSAIACRKCGGKLQKQASSLSKSHHTVKVLTLEEAAAAVTDKHEPPDKEWQFYKHLHKEDLSGQSTLFSAHHLGSWLVFLVLGGLAGWLRYGGFLGPTELAVMKKYAPVILLVLHIVIILAAFKSSMFQGILGLMIPPYPYYFLFAVSDEFYLRAFAGGVLVGIGQDGFVFVSKYGVFIYNLVTQWIASGG
jgi:DNA-directed RNA polymerase subunit M/transcription elongation factor TFIIS